MSGHVILSHGLDSGPDATKVTALAIIAESMGWTSERPDYREDDCLGHAATIRPRIDRLQQRMVACHAPPVLVGSSMGAFVSGLASLQAPVAGLFLLAAPALIPDQDVAFDVCLGVPTLLIHGWRDEVCPLHGLYAFASRRRLPLLIVDDDHRLGKHVETICRQFGFFLEQLAQRV